MKKFYQKIKSFSRLIFIAAPAFVSAIIAKLFIKDLWFIYECGRYARDNGYWMFKYIRENHPNQKVVFCVDKKSPDYKNVKDLGKVCNHRSFMHYFYYFVCSKEISTHPYPNKKLFMNKTYFLQHGVIRDYTGYISDFYKFRLFVTSAYKEHEFIKECYGYDSKYIKLLGLARHDNLIKNINNVNKNQILIMPTWRKYLANVTDVEFMESDYYKSWMNIINNEEFIELLNKFDKKVIFYPHREMQRFLHLFKSKSDRVTIADIYHYDVQQLLISSALLITDYSSVFFDFAYMKKPVLWYLFDEEIYHKGHHGKGYFNEHENILGRCNETEQELLASIKDCMNNDFKLTEIEIKNIEEFYPYFDGKCCERIYNCIKEM